MTTPRSDSSCSPIFCNPYYQNWSYIIYRRRSKQPEMQFKPGVISTYYGSMECHSLWPERPWCQWGNTTWCQALRNVIARSVASDYIMTSVTSRFPYKGSVIRRFDNFFNSSMNKLLKKRLIYRWIAITFMLHHCRATTCLNDVFVISILVSRSQQPWYWSSLSGIFQSEHHKSWLPLDPHILVINALYWQAICST